MKTKPETVKIIHTTVMYNRGYYRKEIDGLGDDGNLYKFDFDSCEWKLYE